MKHCFVLLVFFSVLTGCFSSGDVLIKLNPKTFNDSITQTTVQLVDVRTPKEFNSGHIKNAINIDYRSASFQDSIKLLNSDKPIYIYCRSGKRSSKSALLFKEEGFDTIYELDGGILDWKRQGLNTNLK